jgi:predicted DNA-binding protein with PD1-like motif
MIAVESRHTRRFVVRIERGEEVVASLRKLAQSERIRAAWIRGTGLCEWAEVTDWDVQREALRTPRHLGGPLALLALEGNVSMRLGEPYVELRAVLSREGDAGLGIVGGQLVVVSALNVECVVETFEDVRLERDEERETGLSVWKGERTQGVVARATQRGAPLARGASGRHAAASSPAPAEPTVATVEEQGPPVGAAPSWSDVARASAGVPEGGKKPARPLVPIFDRVAGAPRPAEEAEPEPQKGDWVDHRQFGLCRVDGVDAEGGLVIRLASGQRKVIYTDALEVMPPRFEAERRIFALRPRRR